MRESWTDERLDLLNERVVERFDQVDRRLGHVEARLDRVEARLDSIQRTMIYGVVSLTGGMIAGFSAIVALVATQT